MTGIDCPDCLNRGDYLEITNDGYEVVRFCHCLEARRAGERIARSGFSATIDRLTFDSYTSTEPWQVSTKEMAQEYLRELRSGGDRWFTLTGQPGCGKTHLCTAICGSLLKDGQAVMYAMWASEIRKIKAKVLDENAMEDLFYPLMNAKILYIDDLFKGCGRSAGIISPSDAEKRLAFELINFRYTTRRPTIISCEYSLSGELLAVDDATFSRVYEMSGKYNRHIKPEIGRNYRMASA